MASSAQLEMIELGQQSFPDPAADGTIPQQGYSEIGRPVDRGSLDPSDPLPMTPQQRNDRREGGTPPIPSAPSDATPLQINGGGSMQQLELLGLHFPHRPVLDDIDRTLRRKARVRLKDILELNASDKEGFAPLHYAVLHQRTDIIRKLLGAKCDRTKDGLTPLHIAACQLPRGSDSSTETEGATDTMSTSREVIQLLLEPDEKSVVGDLLQAQEDLRKRTPLHLACSRANAPAVQELLKHIHVKEVDQDIVNMKDNHGDTPLHEACISGHVGIVKEMLKHGADPDARNNDGIYPLEIACMADSVKVVQAILDYNQESKELPLSRVRVCYSNMELCSVGESVLIAKDHQGYAFSMKGNVSIHIAAEKGNIDIAREFLDRDESCKDLLDEQDRSPLHYAARNNQVEIIELLLSKGCNKDMLDTKSVSPLLLSVKCGKARAVKALIEAGCNITTTDKYGNSVIYWAAKDGHLGVLEVILEHEEGRALLAEILDHVNTPFHVAAKMGKTEVLELLTTCLHGHLQQRLEQMSDEREQERLKKENLMRKLEHYEFRNGKEQTPLHLAAICGNLKVVKFLVCKDCPSISDKDEDDYTALHLATWHGKTEVAAFLIKEGARARIVDARDWCRFTPLHTAAHYGHAKIASLLIKADAPLEAKDIYHKSPLYVAAEEGHAEIISILIEAGADLEAKADLNRTPLHVAAEEGHAEIVSLLIGARANVKAKADQDKTPLWLACWKGHLAAAEVLIKNKALEKDDGTGTQSLNCLDVAVKEGHKNVALAIIQSDQWEAEIHHSDGQTTLFGRMIQQMPFVAKAVLDRCMETNAVSEEIKSKVWVKFNYELLVDKTEEQAFFKLLAFFKECKKQGKIEEHPLALMVKYSRRKLLQHPVVTSLLEYKWRRYGGMLFFANLFVYLIFLFFLTMYALRLPHPDHLFCYNFSVSQQVPSLPVNGTVCPFESAFANRSSDVLSNKYTVDPTILLDSHVNASLYFAAVMVIICVLIRLVLEFCQFLRQGYRYFLKYENYIEVVAYISAFIFVSHFGSNCWCPTNWKWQLGAIAVFLAWINLILFLKRLPLLGIYVLMFNAILHSFLKFALIAFLFVVAFCIAFYMILYKALDDATLVVNVSPFRNAGLSFIKTMVMAIGEFDYDNIFGHNNESRSLLSSFPVLAYILWIMFLIVMPILVTNLLVGLAVGDIKAIQDEAELRSNLLQIEADKLLPVSIRRKLIEPKQTIRFRDQKMNFGRWLKFFWRKVLQKTWGVECWDSLDNIRKCKQSFSEQLKKFNNKQDQTQTKAPSGEKRKQHTEVSPSAPVPDQTGDLSIKVQQLQTEMAELMKKNNRIMEKNNHMEQLLQLMAQKLGVEEADRLDEGEG